MSVTRFRDRLRLFARAATAPLIAAGFLMSAVAPEAAAATAITMPQDESVHTNAVDEWWYFTGNLTGVDAGGNQHSYGYEITFFKNEPLPYIGASIYIGHYAITDVNRGTHETSVHNYSMQTDTIPPGGGFDMSLPDAHMTGINGNNSAGATVGDYSFDLKQNTTLPPALHGNGGFIQYGSFGTSYYYSRPNLATTGTITDHGVPVKVSGTSWFDHQWGDWTAHCGGWDWFSLQLGNNTQYMIYMLKNCSGTVDEKLGTLIKSDGTTQNIDPNSITETTQGNWTSPSGHTYSSGWQLALPGGSLTIEPKVIDQEMYDPYFDKYYWEGAGSVTGTINNQAITGQSYTEINPSSLIPRL